MNEKYEKFIKALESNIKLFKSADIKHQKEIAFRIAMSANKLLAEIEDMRIKVNYK